MDCPAINSTFGNNSVNKELLGFREFEFSSPCLLNFLIELAFESTEQAVVDVEYYIVKRIAGFMTVVVRNFLQRQR